MNRLLVGDQNRPQLPPSPGSREIPTRRSNFNCRVPEYLAVLQPAAPPVMAGRGHLARQNFRMRACSGGKLLPDATFLALRGRFPLWRRILGFSHGINSAIAQAKRRLEKRRGRTEGETEEAKVAIRWYFIYVFAVLLFLFALAVDSSWLCHLQTAAALREKRGEHAEPKGPSILWSCRD